MSVDLCLGLAAFLGGWAAAIYFFQRSKHEKQPPRSDASDNRSWDFLAALVMIDMLDDDNDDGVF